MQVGKILFMYWSSLRFVYGVERWNVKAIPTIRPTNTVRLIVGAAASVAIE